MFWHQFVRYHRTRTLLYFFLNWQSPHALKILLALLSAIALFFGVGYLLSNYLLSNLVRVRVRVRDRALLRRGLPPL